jgi:predicted hotdog family 3-hydroxylacyl-ACP dehydratase
MTERIAHYTSSLVSEVALKPPLGREEIERILPHREPFLLIDEVLELEPGARVVARKTVRPDEWYLAGHFPGRPVMPGVLIVEALAQTGAPSSPPTRTEASWRSSAASTTFASSASWNRATSSS